jgi:GTP diphosphokinase / guanosine-3',5'-bis(diphosphate) 3'-diphosphatase
MMRQYELVERVTAYDPEANETLLNRAYVYAMKAHGSQKRASGDPYFSHPLEVAAILTELKLDDATIVAALLHDVIEDTDATNQEIEELFGSDIAGLVEGLTKIKRLDLVTREAAQAENLRKLLSRCPRTSACCWSSSPTGCTTCARCTTWRPTSASASPRKPSTSTPRSPAAWACRRCATSSRTTPSRPQSGSPQDHLRSAWPGCARRSGDAIAEIEKALRDKLAANSIAVEVYGREKRPYSIWRKMERKHVSLGQLSDIFGFRVIVSSLDECYRALGIAHFTWRAVPGRFKDYISNPKQNGYRSLHTTVIGPRHMRVELQIRTREMHEVAERGIAAHGFYKDAPSVAEAERGVHVDGPESQAYQWLRHLIDILSEGDNPKEFLEHTRLELFHDQVFCFTPKGDLIALPRGANAIDFAYAVHTDIGNSCVGCRINGRHAPLMSELENGDEVEIIRSPAQVPPAAWEGLAVTGKARAAIRRATRMAIRNQYAGLGRAILERALAKHDRAFSDKELAGGGGARRVQGPRRCARGAGPRRTRQQ